MTAHPLAFGAMKSRVEQMPRASQAKTTKMVEDRLPGWEVGREIPPGAATPNDVEDGVKDATERMGAASASCR
jgi:hypothetical protein